MSWIAHRWHVPMVSQLACCALFLTACPTPPAEELGCLESVPQRLDAPCSGDGDCGNWLQCGSDHCVIPPAALGEGGRALDVRDGADIVASLRVEVARSDLRRARGLAHRPCIVDGWGMLIEFPATSVHHLETAQMQFDLDIAMAGDNRIVHTVHRGAAAGGEALYSSDQPFRWVLETRTETVPLVVGYELQLGVETIE